LFRSHEDNLAAIKAFAKYPEIEVLTKFIRKERKAPRTWVSLRLIPRSQVNQNLLISQPHTHVRLT
jgi:hypothetical protein